MDDNLKDCVYFTYQTLEHYIDVHNEIFNSPKGIIGKIRKFFKPMNFSSYLDILNKSREQLSDIRELMVKVDSENINQQEQKLINILKQFNLALEQTIVKLCIICKGLLAKSQNKSYPIGQYQSDVSTYEQSVIRYSEIGTELNEIHHTFE